MRTFLARQLRRLADFVEPSHTGNIFRVDTRSGRSFFNVLGYDSTGELVEEFTLTRKPTT